jgi:hypothetical protein
MWYKKCKKVKKKLFDFFGRSEKKKRENWEWFVKQALDLGEQSLANSIIIDFCEPQCDGNPQRWKEIGYKY